MFGVNASEYNVKAKVWLHMDFTAMIPVLLTTELVFFLKFYSRCSLLVQNQGFVDAL